MIDALKSTAIVILLWINAVLIVTGCNMIGTNAVAVQIRAKAEIVREQDAKFESIVTASSLH